MTWKFLAQERPDYIDRVDLIKYDPVSRQVAYFEDGVEKFEAAEGRFMQNNKPWMSVDRSDIPALMTALTRLNGIRMQDAAEAELSATKHHLEDLRKMLELG